jgi:hypothetical protein
LNSRLREIHSSCRDLLDNIGLITSGKMSGDLTPLYKKLASFCQEAIQISSGVALRGHQANKHQHDAAVWAAAGGKPVGILGRFSQG